MPAAQMQLLDETHRKQIVKTLRELDKVAAAVALVEKCGVECGDRRAVLDYLYGEYQKLHANLWPDTPLTTESTS